MSTNACLLGAIRKLRHRSFLLWTLATAIAIAPSIPEKHHIEMAKGSSGFPATLSFFQRPHTPRGYAQHAAEAPNLLEWVDITGRWMGAGDRFCCTINPNPTLYPSGSGDDQWRDCGWSLVPPFILSLGVVFVWGTKLPFPRYLSLATLGPRNKRRALALQEGSIVSFERSKASFPPSLPITH